jgi:crossover junction endodeoxyribonuclease RuvC
VDNGPSYNILGIDPGTNLLGFAVIDIFTQNIKVVEIGVLNFTKIKNHQQKLMHIHQNIHELILKYKPYQMAIEAPFYGKNIQSMLKLGRAQGVAIAAALINGVNVEEYSPKKIKQAITGNGNASKEQVSGMLKNIVDFKHFNPQLLDATDALAVALCHHFQNKLLQQKTRQFSNWSDFASTNKERIKS